MVDHLLKSFIFIFIIAVSYRECDTAFAEQPIELRCRLSLGGEWWVGGTGHTFSRDSSKIAFPHDDGVRVYDAHTGQLQQECDVTRVFHTTWGPKDEWLALSGGNVHIWRMDGDRPETLVEIHEEKEMDWEFGSIVLNRDGSRLFAIQNDGDRHPAVYEWNTRSFELVNRTSYGFVTEYDKSACLMDISADGNRLLCSEFPDVLVNLAKGGHLVNRQQLIDGGELPAGDDLRISGKSVRIFDIRCSPTNPDLLALLVFRSGQAHSGFQELLVLKYTPERPENPTTAESFEWSRQLVIADRDREIRGLDETHKFWRFRDRIAWHPNGHLIAIGTGYGGLLFDIRHPEVVAAYFNHLLNPEEFTASAKITDCLEFSPDGRSLLSRANDNFVRIWDIPEKLYAPAEQK